MHRYKAQNRLRSFMLILIERITKVANKIKGHKYLTLAI